MAMTSIKEAAAVELGEDKTGKDGVMAKEVGRGGMERMPGMVTISSDQMESRHDDDEGTAEQGTTYSGDEAGSRVASVVTLSGLSSMCRLRYMFRMKGQVIMLGPVQRDAWRHSARECSCGAAGRIQSP